MVGDPNWVRVRVRDYAFVTDGLEKAGPESRVGRLGMGIGVQAVSLCCDEGKGQDQGQGWEFEFDPAIR